MLACVAAAGAVDAEEKEEYEREQALRPPRRIVGNIRTVTPQAFAWLRIRGLALPLVEFLRYWGNRGVDEEQE